eukprot:Blabericola_migrator_1__4982@NODE_258_length_10736_cov_58_864373_g216_i0_p5_GENE_NODE_258_length_10736_cov_58_864373_g216_i0NODE_258_length_10736_cov_58_864373_g216_i0_p5_ORF_typecomplete_len133_score17_50DUF1493/PF07377_12/0_04_NODE_258_length_10736_cov_58_864373_g216_i065996997
MNWSLQAERIHCREDGLNRVLWCPSRTPFPWNSQATRNVRREDELNKARRLARIDLWRALTKHTKQWESPPSDFEVEAYFRHLSGRTTRPPLPPISADTCSTKIPKPYNARRLTVTRAVCIFVRLTRGVPAS